jgi:hypothetical protein
VLAGPMRLDCSVVGVALHEHVGVRLVAVIELIKQAALLVLVDLLDELGRDLLEFRALAFLDLDRCDDTQNWRYSLKNFRAAIFAEFRVRLQQRQRRLPPEHARERHGRLPKMQGSG